MKSDQVIDILLRQGIVSRTHKGKIDVVLQKSPIHRRPEKTTQRYTVEIAGKPEYSVKFLPASWGFRPEDIVRTYQVYSQLESIRVPKLVAHLKVDDGSLFVEQFLQDAVPLDQLVEQRSVSGIHAADLLRQIFSELYSKGTPPSTEFFRSEKDQALGQLKEFLREGIWSEIILSYVGQVIDRHASSLRMLDSSGDIIDRNIVKSNGDWFLIDFEYSHRTMFGFKEAYRNILYAEWARNMALHDLYRPLGDFPADVAAMIALAWENHFQSDILDEQNARITQRHLRYLFWNVVDPSILPQLDRRAAEAESLAGAKQAELETISRSLNETVDQRIGLSQELERLNERVRQIQDELAKAFGRIGQQDLLLKEKEDRIVHLEGELAARRELLADKDRQIEGLESDKAEANKRGAQLADELTRDRQNIERKDQRIQELEAWGNEMRTFADQKESTIAFQQRSIDDLSSRERTLYSRLADAENKYHQKSAEYIYVKSTLSYSLGRIITAPFALFYDLSVKLFVLLDKSLGPALWPPRTRRAEVVDALVHLRQTIATGTYLLRVQGIAAFTEKVKERLHMRGTRRVEHDGGVIPHPRGLPVRPGVENLYDPRSESKIDVGISVIIPTLNESENIIKLLPVLNGQKGFTTIETIIIDSGSTDDTIELAEEYGATVITISPEEFSHSHARNLGAEHASQPYLLFTTADALPSSEMWLYEMYMARERLNVTAVSCKEVPRADADLYSRVQSWYHYKYFLELDNKDKVLSLPEGRNPISLRKHSQLSDVACLIPKDVFSRYKFRYEYGEDLDLGVRLVRDNHRLGLLQSTCIIHSHNRPTYYHLKRGYIDKLVLAKILNEPPEHVNYEITDVLWDIVGTYIGVADISTDHILDGRETLSVQELQSAAISLIDSVSRSIGVRKVEKSEFVDRQFFSFVEGILEQIGNEQHKKRISGDILAGLKQYLLLTFEYLKQTHERVDRSVVNDLIGLIFKDLANLAGVYIALSLAHTDNGGGTLISNLRSELGDGRILWEEKLESKESIVS